MTGEGEGKEGTTPTPFHLFFFCSRSNFRAITRLQTLTTQATLSCEIKMKKIYICIQ